MTSLLCDISIWSLRDDERGLLVRDTDFSCFKYYDKNQQKSQAERPYAQVHSYQLLAALIVQIKLSNE